MPIMRVPASLTFAWVLLAGIGCGSSDTKLSQHAPPSSSGGQPAAPVGTPVGSTPGDAKAPPAESTKPLAPDPDAGIVKISARELLDEVMTATHDIEAKYRGKRLRITGEVSEVSGSFVCLGVDLDDKDQQYSVRMQITDPAELKSLKGKTLRVTGTVAEINGRALLLSGRIIDGKPLTVPMVTDAQTALTFQPGDVVTMEGVFEEKLHIGCKDCKVIERSTKADSK